MCLSSLPCAWKGPSASATATPDDSLLYINCRFRRYWKQMDVLVNPFLQRNETNIVYNANKHRKAAGLLPEDVAAITIQTTLRAFELDGASIFGDAIEYP
ncbi:hypothetical protein Tco_0513398 [Tanacetum coccineum]